MIIDESSYLAHYGIIRRSGRYPWGSSGWGDGPEDTIKRNKTFLDYIRDLIRKGWTEKEVADSFGVTITQLRAEKTLANNEMKQAQIGMAQRLKDKGYSNVAIGERMGLNESSVRALLAPGAKDKADIIITTSTMLKGEVDSKGFIDIGTGVEHHLGISKEKLNVAVAALREQGYEVHRVKITQVGTGLETEMKVLAPPGVTQKEVWMNRDKIQQLGVFSQDKGRSFTRIQDPISINPDRIQVKYANEGGDEADGVIFVRPGVEDLSLGNSRYAQVRIKVGDEHYLKGMAVYKDDMPKGVDLIFNTNKDSTGNKLDAMKALNDDPDFPFGAVVRQIVDKPGSEDAKVISAMNLVNDQGDWTQWSKSLPSQFLSKQSPTLASQQLDVTFERRNSDLNDILSLTNPTIKKKLLEKFAEDADSAAVHLAAAGLPRQNWHVILPVNSIPPGQVYAPNYRDGETLVLIRFPHGGIFELPELVVNNKNQEAKKLLGDAPDALAIHHTVAQRLSGADFDGDTVIAVPKGRIKTAPALEGLKNFDPQRAYPAYEGMRRMTSRETQLEMGKVSNLITDMTIRGASHNEIAKAVRHSMVVIDAEKHGLNWKQSEIDNGIANLKAKYQGRADAGASTIISKASAETRVLDRKPRPQADGGPVDKKTGELVWVNTGRTRTDRSGKEVPIKQRTTKMAETRDAHKLSSGTQMERIYADHANRLKSLANQARLEALKTPPLKYSPSAKRAYSNEVASLDSKLTLALQNAPRERQAQILANTIIQAKRDSNPHLEGDQLKKIRFQALEEARLRVGAGKQRIDITPREWEAIQAGAISNNKLEQILNNTNVDTVRKLATPRPKVLMTNAKVSRAQSMFSSGYTRAEVADALGVSLSTLDASVQQGE